MIRYCVFILASFSLVFAKQSLLFKIDDFDKGELYSRLFSLDEEQTVKIDFIAPIKKRNKPYCAIWILNLDNHKTVWEFYDQDPEERVDKYNHEFKDEITLPEGNYELYVSTFRGGYHTYNNSYSFGDFLDQLFDGDFSSSLRTKYLRRMEVSLYADGNLPGSYKKNKELSLIDLTRMGDSEYHQIGLNVKENTKVEVYGLGEILREGSYDHALIRDLNSRRIIWDMDFRNTDHAGGGEKNRSKQDVIELEKGKYLVQYVSDDSHHYRDWNVSPPHDPRAWGLTINFLNKSDKSNITKFDYQENYDKNVLFAIDRAGDDFYEKKTFEVFADVEIGIFALGEGTEYSGMVDYAWIDNLQHNRKVWEMEYDETDHAGGATKNRKVDLTIKLSKGIYSLYYVTDDSHSYGDRFNASAPAFPKKWGVTLYLVDENKDSKSKIKFLDKDFVNDDIVAEIVRVRDHEKERKEFTVKDKQKIRIVAIGEGDDDDMYDYGWIKDADSRRTVWRMRYEDSRHAGGARKNRIVDEIIELDEGTYYLYYRSDGSHSFRDWNASPPRDRERWGITLYKVK